MPSELIAPPPARVNLEERLAWLERHVTAQDKEMLALHDALARLRRELTALRTVSAARDNSGETPPTEERPPHY